MERICLLLTLAVKMFSLWFLLTALMFWKKPRAYEKSMPRTRFACLIAARNEEAVIAALVESLRAQDYPNALYDIYVIPNNCTDDTENAARAAGAKIFRCFTQIACKGDALHEAVDWLLPQRRYDAVCVFDADNVVDPGFLAAMNDAMCAGARVCKARLLVKKPYDSAVAGCYALYFTLCDFFFSRSRANLGLSAKLVGTGFAVHRSVLEKLGGWNTETIAEDAEFSCLCAAAGERVCWVPEAVTYDEAPERFAVSMVQRRRWVSGIMSVCTRRLAELLHPAAGADRLRVADMTMFLCAPFAQALSALPLLIGLASAAAAGRVGAFAAPLGVSLIGMLAFALFLVLLSPYRNRRILCAAALFPIFMASWLPLQVLGVLRRTTVWREIRHSRSIGARELGRAA